MGYNAYITRRKQWSDGDGSSITEGEWFAHVGADPELIELYWNRGNIEGKNPDIALVRKMVAAATALGATVQGDDGESYDSAGKPIPPPPPSLVSRVAWWIRNQLSRGATPAEEASVPFMVGDRVRDPWGNSGRVTGIDVRAEHGLGRVTVKYEDGRISHTSAHSSGFWRADA